MSKLHCIFQTAVYFCLNSIIHLANPFPDPIDGPRCTLKYELYWYFQPISTATVHSFSGNLHLNWRIRKRKKFPENGRQVFWDTKFVVLLLVHFPMLIICFRTRVVGTCWGWWDWPEISIGRNYGDRVVRGLLRALCSAVLFQSTAEREESRDSNLPHRRTCFADHGPTHSYALFA